MSSYSATINGKTFLVEVPEGGACSVDGQRVHAELRPAGQSGCSILVDGESFFFLAERIGNAWEVSIRGVTHKVKIETERERLLRAYTSAASAIQRATAIAAPMPAMVVRVAVKPGDTIAAGDGLVVLEAMKMENEIRAPNGGTVKEVRVAPGQTVEKGEVLLILE